MKTIYFTCPWEDSTSLLNKMKRNTPSSQGIWKNIQGTDDINNFDYMVVLDDLHPSLLRKGPEALANMVKKPNRVIYFQRENTNILKKSSKSWFTTTILPRIEHRYSYENDFFYTFTTAHFLNKTYDELKSMEYPHKTRNISCVVSNKNLDTTYQNRINFIKEYSSRNKDTIDIYGNGWKNELGSNYKGELGSYHQNGNQKSSVRSSKIDGLLPYDYSMCLENYPDEKKLGEKITDALLSWCMPIYSGPACTSKYYPADAFHLIKIDENNIYERVSALSKLPISEKNISAISEARNLILDKYNIWEQVHSIIEDPMKFKIDYNHN